MKCGKNTRLFYSTQIPCTKEKTELSILYYISTTNNAFKRVNKNDIESLNIPAMIESLRTSSRPFSLRLYSFLVKGIVKVYALKLKYCENEILSILSNFQVRKIRERKFPVPKKENDIILKIDDDFISSYSDISEENEINIPTPLEDVNIGIDNSNECDYENDIMRVDAVPVKRHRKSTVIDKEVEVENNWLKLQKNTVNPVEKDVPEIFLEFENFLKNAKEKKFLFPEIAEENDDIYMPLSQNSAFSLTQNTTNMNFTQESFVMESYQEKNENNPLSQINNINQMIFSEESFCFNEKFRRYEKDFLSNAFYRILEESFKESILVEQDGPYQNIFINVLNN